MSRKPIGQCTGNVRATYGQCTGNVRALCAPPFVIHRRVYQAIGGCTLGISVSRRYFSLLLVPPSSVLLAHIRPFIPPHPSSPQLSSCFRFTHHPSSFIICAPAACFLPTAVASSSFLFASLSILPSDGTSKVSKLSSHKMCPTRFST